MIYECNKDDIDRLSTLVIVIVSAQPCKMTTKTLYMHMGQTKDDKTNNNQFKLTEPAANLNIQLQKIIMLHERTLCHMLKVTTMPQIV